MSTEKHELIDEALRMLLDSVRDAKEFVIEQAPQLAQEIIAYGRVKNWLLVALLVVTCSTLGYFCYLMAQKALRISAARHYGEEAFWAGAVVLAILAIVAGVNAIIAADSAIMATFAPRLYLLRELAEMVRGK